MQKIQSGTAGYVDGFVDVGEGKVYYELAGEGPFLVLAHAGFVDRRMWDGQWQAFAQSYRVVRYDMRGYGQSDPVAGPVARRTELFQLLQQLGIHSAHWLGASMGGEVMLDLAIEHPEMVQGLITVGSIPGGFALQGEPPTEVVEMFAAMQQGDLAKVSELQLRLWIDGPFRGPEEVDADVRRRAWEMNQTPVQQGTWGIADMQPANPLTPPAVDRLHELQVPTLVMAGALDNPEILRAASVMGGAIPGAQQVILPGSAHVPNMEQPDAFNQTVLDFLRGVG